MPIKVAELYATLNLDTAEFDRKLEDAKRRLSSVRGTARLGGTGGVGGGGGGSSFMGAAAGAFIGSDGGTSRLPTGARPTSTSWTATGNAVAAMESLEQRTGSALWSAANGGGAWQNRQSSGLSPSMINFNKGTGGGSGLGRRGGSGGRHTPFSLGDVENPLPPSDVSGGGALKDFNGWVKESTKVLRPFAKAVGLISAAAYAGWKVGSWMGNQDYGSIGIGPVGFGSPTGHSLKKDLSAYWQDAFGGRGVGTGVNRNTTGDWNTFGRDVGNRQGLLNNYSPEAAKSRQIMGQLRATQNGLDVLANTLQQQMPGAGAQSRRILQQKMSAAIAGSGMREKFAELGEITSGLQTQYTKAMWNTRVTITDADSAWKIMQQRVNDPQVQELVEIKTVLQETLGIMRQMNPNGQFGALESLLAK